MHAYRVSSSLFCKVTEATCRSKVVVVLLEGLSHITGLLHQCVRGPLYIYLSLSPAVGYYDVGKEEDSNWC